VQVALLGLEDADDVGEGILGALLASGIPRERDGHADTDNTRLEEDVADGNVSERLGSLTGLLEVTIGELDGLGALGAALTGDDDLATLGLRLHDEANDTIGGTADSETLEKLELHRLSLGNGGEATVEHALGVELDGTIAEAKTLLDDYRGRSVNMIRQNGHEKK